MRRRRNAGAKLLASVHSYGSAAHFLGNRSERKLAHNTYVHWVDDSTVGVRLHRTDIVLFHRDGSITLDSGGYQTTTTKARMNELLPPPLAVFQKKFEWFVRLQSHAPYIRGEYRSDPPQDFIDGMRLKDYSGTGQWKVVDEEEDEYMSNDPKLHKWIQENRAELATAILRVSPTEDITEETIEMWVNNDEGLYEWAMSEGAISDDDDDDDDDDGDIEWED